MFAEQLLGADKSIVSTGKLPLRACVASGRLCLNSFGGDVNMLLGKQEPAPM